MDGDVEVRRRPVKGRIMEQRPRRFADGEDDAEEGEVESELRKPA